MSGTSHSKAVPAFSPGLAAQDHHQPGPLPDAGRLRQPPSEAPGSGSSSELLTAGIHPALLGSGVQGRDSCNGASRPQPVLISPAPEEQMPLINAELQQRKLWLLSLIREGGGQGPAAAPPANAAPKS